jgi:hypothetical protein
MATTIPTTDRMPCAVAQPRWLLLQALDYYKQSTAHWKSVSHRERSRRKFFAYARQVIPIIGGKAFIDDFKSYFAGTMGQEGLAVAEELVREMAAGK